MLMMPQRSQCRYSQPQGLHLWVRSCWMGHGKHKLVWTVSHKVSGAVIASKLPGVQAAPRHHFVRH